MLGGEFWACALRRPIQLDEPTSKNVGLGFRIWGFTCGFLLRFFGRGFKFGLAVQAVTKLPPRKSPQSTAALNPLNPKP